MELIKSIVERALENGFEPCKYNSTLHGVQFQTYCYETGFSVNGEHSYDMVRIYLVVNEELNLAYLCYSPTIAILIPSNDDYHEWLDKAAKFASNVTAIDVYSDHDIRGEFEPNPLTAKIKSPNDVENLEWFIIAITSYQTVIEIMVEGRWQNDLI